MRRRVLLIVVVWLALAIGYGLASDSVRIWPYRNTLFYYVTKQLGSLAPSADLPRGTLSGVVRAPNGAPIAGARVLLSTADGSAFAAESDAQGRYQIEDVPEGSYTPVAGAPGYADTSLHTLLGIGVTAVEPTTLDLTLTPRRPSEVVPATNVRLSEPVYLRIDAPLPASAARRTLEFDVDGRANQLTFVYTPNDGQDQSNGPPLPVLLAVYPGSADTWESVSLPLAQAGYTVIAVGPAYALDLEQDIDDLERVVDLVRGGAIPRARTDWIGALAGSYSGLHVLRLAVHEPSAIDAALLLGPPTDLFELRRQFEAGTFLPPFGLDQALVALGLPGSMPERYWRYSARYHAASLNLPVMLIHSKEDEVVPFTQSQLLADELARLGKPHELHILEGMGHYLLATERTPAIDDLFATTIDFFGRQWALHNQQ